MVVVALILFLLVLSARVTTRAHQQDIYCPARLLSQLETAPCSCEASLFWWQWRPALRPVRKRLSIRISNVFASPRDTKNLMRKTSVTALMFAKLA
jgi:hypothetical protein